VLALVQAAEAMGAESVATGVDRAAELNGGPEVRDTTRAGACAQQAEKRGATIV
jgi:hypothetical protein